MSYRYIARTYSCSCGMSKPMTASRTTIIAHACREQAVLRAVVETVERVNKLLCQSERRFRRRFLSGSVHMCS